MAELFDDVTLEWKGQTLTIPAKRALKAIARIEEHVTLNDLLSGRHKLTALSAAYASVLRYAGVVVTDDEVYDGLFEGDVRAQGQAAVQGLLMMMVPRKTRQKMEREIEDANTAPAAAEASPAGNGRRRTRGTAASSSETPTS